MVPCYGRTNNSILYRLYVFISHYFIIFISISEELSIYLFVSFTTGERNWGLCWTSSVLNALRQLLSQQLLLGRCSPVRKTSEVFLVYLSLCVLFRCDDRPLIFTFVLYVSLLWFPSCVPKCFDLRLYFNILQPRLTGDRDVTTLVVGLVAPCHVIAITNIDIYIYWNCDALPNVSDRWFELIFFKVTIMKMSNVVIKLFNYLTF
jgi:hypothetical protein